MSRRYKTPIGKAYPDIKVIEPKVSRWLIPFLRPCGRIYLFVFCGIARIVSHGDKADKALFEAFRRALAGESRLIIAFRHPNGGEPQLLSWFFLFKLRKIAARVGVRFVRRPHAVTVYGYEVVRWGGWIARFVMPNLGAMPIHHAKMDSQGMARIYKAISEGAYPLALAPEGQVSYTSDDIPRLEPGTIRIGFHAAERLEAKGVTCPVEVLPVTVHFRFGSWGRVNIEVLLKKIEKVCGLSGKNRKGLPFVERLRQCRDYILAVNEKRYQIEADESLSFDARLGKVIDAALGTAERMIGARGEGDFFSRIYKVRQYYWDRIFLPGVDSLDGKSYLERNVMDLQAGEAWYIGRHQELIDFCWYFRVPLPVDDAAFHTKIEYVQNLWDFASRTMGGAYPDRVNIFPRKVIVQAAPVINLSERLPSYHSDKKAAIAAAMADLEKAYRDSISEMNRVEKG